ncbi:MAG: hypothetical protein LBL55_07070, partial [Propionibacteriaceae bacterium]|nr:hypothetical protein [Propionibacteriaceae bacterium]
EALPAGGLYVTVTAQALDGALTGARSVLLDLSAGDDAVASAYRSLEEAVTSLKADSLEQDFVDGAVFIQGSTAGLTHVSARDLSLHTGLVSVDGVTLTAGTDYQVSVGSTVVRLEPGYLAGLSVGQHSLTVGFAGGWSAEASFSVQSAGGLPATGWPAGLDRWVAVWLLAAGAVSAVALFRRLSSNRRSDAHTA